MANSFLHTAKLNLDQTKLNHIANTALNKTVELWFLSALIGQFIFSFYIIALYGGTGINGQMESWNQILPHGYTNGDTIGNAFLIAHLILAAIISIGGPLQLIPKIRSRFPAFHSWNGRVYIFVAFAISIDGLYLNFSGRKMVGDFIQHANLAFMGILIMIFASLALYHAINRNFDAHRRWALRLFLVVSGVWFLRIGLMFWVFINGGKAVGFDPETFVGPFLTVLSFAQYLLPLFILEIYLRIQTRGGAAAKISMAIIFVIMSIATTIGFVIATMAIWLPRI